MNRAALKYAGRANGSLQLVKSPHVVIIGGGFGGARAALRLARTPARITLIDRNNYSLFQPFLYQVATTTLSGEQIAVTIRSLFRRYSSVQVLMAEAKAIDVARKQVTLDGRALSYDFLIVASGVEYNYFGHDSWRKNAPSLKSIHDADSLRLKILNCFEQAEISLDPRRVRSLLTFILVGAGPTGVEMAGALAYLANTALRKDFRCIRPESARIILLEGGPRILASFHPQLQERALENLKKRKIEVRTGAAVTEVDSEGVVIGTERIEAATVIWTAGVRATPLASSLPGERDKGGKIQVLPDLSIPGHPEISVIGDLAHLTGAKGKPLPGVAQVAMQQGYYVARKISALIQGRSKPGAFAYHDKGNMAVIGRSFAIVELPRLKFSGRLAWLLWLGVHLFYNFNLKNRILVIIEWGWAYFTQRTTVRLLDADDASSARSANESASPLGMEHHMVAEKNR